MSAQQEYKELYAKYKAAIDKLSTVTAERDAIVSLVQKYQPAGSPPPGDAQILVSWIMRSLADGVPPAHRPSKIAALEAELKEAGELFKDDHTYQNSNDDRTCFYCGSSDIFIFDEIRHKPDCPWELHRARVGKAEG